MKKLTCETCGGKMELDESKEFATCPYCNTKYKLNEDKNIYIKFDEDTKKIFNDGVKSAKKVSLLVFIPHIIITIVVFAFIIFVGFNIFKAIKSQINDDSWSSVEKSSFNSKYEMYSGTTNKFHINYLLDNVVTNNKKDKDHLVTVIYKDNSTTDPDEIVNIKHSLEDKNYEIKLDYNEDELVNKITIEDIE